MVIILRQLGCLLHVRLLLFFVRESEMKVLTNVICLLLALGVCAGQVTNNSKVKTRPNLSGVWALDNSRSNLMEKVDDYVLTIVHQEPEVRMKTKYKQGG